MSDLRFVSIFNIYKSTGSSSSSCISDGLELYTSTPVKITVAVDGTEDTSLKSDIDICFHSGLQGGNNMFINAKSVRNVKIHNFKPTSLYNFCYNANSIEELNTGEWDTSQCTNMHGALYGMSSLKSVDLSNWDTSKVTSFCAALADLHLCPVIDVSGWDTSKGSSEFMWAMFGDCRSVELLDLRSFDVSHNTNCNSFFIRCYKLRELRFGTFDMGKCTTASGMFGACSSLTTVSGTITGLKTSVNLGDSPLTNSSAMVFINGAETVSSAQTLTFSAETYATLTEEQIAIATSKGWNVAHR